MRIVKINTKTHHQGIKKRLKNVVLDTTQEYASITTIHGFSYILDQLHSIPARVIWMIIVIIAGLLTTLQMSSLYRQWKDDPVITTLDTVAMPIKDIEFPAVTICPQGSVKEILDNVLFKQMKEYIRKKTLNGKGTAERPVSNNETDSQSISYDEMMRQADEFLKDVLMEN